MKGITYRNKNEGRVDAKGKAKKPSWSYRFETAPVGGKRQFCEKSGFATKEEAIREGTAAFKKYLDGGSVFEQTNMSYSDCLDSWFENYVKVECLPTTLTGYEKRVKNYIRPVLGKYSLKALRRETIQKLINDLFKRQFSRNTLVSVLGIISNSLHYAVKMDWIERNPADDVDIPAARRCTENRKKEREPVPRDVLEKIFNRFPEGHPAHVPLMLAYHCGLRLGEVFGLSWKDVDLENGEIMVEHQVQWSQPDGLYRLVAPKYDSRRNVRLDDEIWALLRRENAKCKMSHMAFGETYKQLYVDEKGWLNTEQRGEPIDMVTCRPDGSYVQERTTEHYSKVVRNEIGYTKFDFHSLRHTHATELSEAGVNIKEIQRRLGHSTMEVTSKRYLHATEAMSDESVELMNKMLKRRQA